MRSGTVCPRPPLVPLTSVIDFTLRPTPNASDGDVLRFSTESIVRNLDRGHPAKLVALLRLTGVDAARIPAVYEWAMGLPPGWTDSGGASTPSCRRRPSGSAAASSRR